MPTDQPTAAQLRDRYGIPDMIDATIALRLLGAGPDINPDEVAAYRYPSLEAAKAFADGNRRHHGHDTIGPRVTELGIIAVTDMREQLARLQTEHDARQVT